MPDHFSIRTDPELDAALEYLGVTPERRNRNAIIKEAVMAAYHAKRDLDDPATESPYGDVVIARIPGTTDYKLSFPGPRK